MLICYDTRIRCIEAKWNEYWILFECLWLLWSCAWLGGGSACTSFSEYGWKYSCMLCNWSWRKIRKYAARARSLGHRVILGARMHSIYCDCVYESQKRSRTCEYISHPSSHTIAHVHSMFNLSFPLQELKYSFLYYDGNSRSICISCLISNSNFQLIQSANL